MEVEFCFFSTAEERHSKKYFCFPFECSSLFFPWKTKDERVFFSLSFGAMILSRAPGLCRRVTAARGKYRRGQKTAKRKRSPIVGKLQTDVAFDRPLSSRSCAFSPRGPD